jgi:hypothetical protein
MRWLKHGHLSDIVINIVMCSFVVSHFYICIPSCCLQYRLGIGRASNTRRDIQSNTGKEESILIQLSTSLGKLSSIE